MGAVYLFHDLYGYLMEMSPDIADLIEAFADEATTQDVLDRFANRFEGADPAQFLDVLVGHAVLLEPDEQELDNVWAFVPMKGKWNIWRRHDDRLTLYTAWGERPVTQVMLDPEETRMWNAIDGEMRLAELRLQHDPKKLQALVRRLTHSDVQALKLSLMPWSAFSKRPAMAPRRVVAKPPLPRARDARGRSSSRPPDCRSRTRSRTRAKCFKPSPTRRGSASCMRWRTRRCPSVISRVRSAFRCPR